MRGKGRIVREPWNREPVVTGIEALRLRVAKMVRPVGVDESLLSWPMKWSSMSSSAVL